MTRSTAIVSVCTALFAAAAPAIGDCPSNHTFVVTNVYDIDGVPGAELEVYVGYTYTFELHNPSGHPFFLTFDSIGGPGTSPLPLSTGVSCVCQGCGTCTRRSIVFTPVASLAGQSVFYQCTVHYALGNIIRVKPTPAITVNAQPQPLSRCAGAQAQFTVAAVSNETETLGFQWRRNGQPLSDVAGHIAGAGAGTLTITGVTTQDAGEYTCEIVAPCKTAITGGASLSVNACCPADVGLASGLPGSDGVLNNNDFVAFIDLFFAGDAGADRGGQGGTAGPDGAWDNNDLVVFVDQFFTPC